MQPVNHFEPLQQESITFNYYKLNSYLVNHIMHDAMFDSTKIKIRVQTSFCPVSSYWVPKSKCLFPPFGTQYELVLWGIDKASDKIAHKVVGI